MAFGRQPLRNEFSWSKSRHEKLAECARQYFFHYYASWGGWERGAAPEVKELYTLKKLTARAPWAGSTVHDTIKRALTLVRDGQPADPRELVDRTRARMRAEFRESREKAYRQRKAFGLVEHEYDEPLPDEVWRDNWALVERCIEAFFASRWLSIASDLQPERWLPIDELGSFSFEGTKIFAAPDFAFRTADGGVVVVDWKTGQKRESDREQLRGYAIYARETWGVPLDRIECRVVYLPSLEEVEVRVDESEVAAFSERMKASIENMLSLLVDRDANVATAENFPPTDDEKACARCVFRRPCKG
ncbi:PD-(D/E)XK nuclease family protein [Vulgatibacter sp.]|uniref:PD-(D/E)XK nuclease family protein n=1 Tax=Vulgatibacter sp. TaxID=1971226 RepID=UPI0035627988